MIPLGDAKGAALAFMVEVLAACLPGANLAFEASSFLDGNGPPPATGQLLLAIDPKAFGHAGFGERMAALARRDRATTRRAAAGDAPPCQPQPRGARRHCHYARDRGRGNQSH